MEEALENCNEWLRLGGPSEFDVEGLRDRALADDSIATDQLIELFGHQISFGTAGITFSPSYDQASM